MDFFNDDLLNELEVFDDDLEIMDIFDFGFPRRIYLRSNYFHELDDLTFFKRFRFSKPTAFNILQEIEDQLEFPDDLNNSVSPINQLLTCLRYFATAGHIASVADYMGMHESTACRIIKKTAAVLAQLSNVYITMPAENEIAGIQMQFHEIAGFPRVLGCIDGTHVRIQSPGGVDAEIFRNRKGYFSINVQVFNDSKMRIRNIVARWPGSTHDATIFRNSRLRAVLENNEYPNCVLLGDSGYGLQHYLLTPLLNPVTHAEQLYNEAHIRTRNSIERLFGVWKRRFPVLAYGLRVSIENTLTVIVATAVLHNIAVAANEEIPPPPEENENQLNDLVALGNMPEVVQHNENVQINASRANFINNYFGNL